MSTLVWLALIATGTLAGFWVASALGWMRWIRPSHGTLVPPTNRAHLVGSSEGNRTSGRAGDPVGKQRAGGAAVRSSPVRRTTPSDQQGATLDTQPPKRAPRVEVDTSDESDETTKADTLKKQPAWLSALEEALHNAEPARRSGLLPNDLTDKAHPVNDWWLKGKNTKTEKKKSTLLTEEDRKDAGAGLHDSWLKRLDEMLGNHPLETSAKQRRTRH